MDLHRLRLLAELARVGSMRAVADEMHLTTSTVSQQLAVLAREAGTPLLEPVGRRVRLTPAGRRLADHAVTILAAVHAARLDLDPAAEPAGTVRVAAFASAIRRAILPIVTATIDSNPAVRLQIHEHEPAEALSLLATDDIDLALTYDYNLAPAPVPSSVEVTPLWTTMWGLAVPAVADTIGSAPDVFAHFRDQPWIVNSRNTADEVAVRIIASMAGFQPEIAHRVDSLALVQELVVAGLGVGLLSEDEPLIAGVRLLPLREPDVVMHTYAVTRRGRAGWAPLALTLRQLRSGTTSEPTLND